MLDRIVEFGVEQYAPVEIQEPPSTVLLEVPADDFLGSAVSAGDGGKVDLLIARLEDPRAGLVDHAKDAIARGRRSVEARHEPPRRVEQRLDDETPSLVHEAEFAVEFHARQAVA